MKQRMFIEVLEKKLIQNKVSDIEEIISEYQEHFSYKLEDGYSEEEISIKLGDPTLLANQYAEDNEEPIQNKKFLSVLGLGVLDPFAFMFLVLFIAWIIVLFVFSLSVLGIGFSLFLNISPMGLIPYLPYWCGAVLGVSMISLSILSFVGTYYSYLYLKQVSKSYLRFHKNVFAVANNRPTLPSLSNHPLLSKKKSRRLRSVILMSLNAFAVSFIIGYLVCAIFAESFEFWHVFNWFV